VLTDALFTYNFLFQYVKTKNDNLKPKVSGDTDGEREARILRLKSPLAVDVDVFRFDAGLFHSTAFSHHVQIGPR
jgi:hypothetical protein